MGIGISVFLIAVGAVMAFAIDVQNNSGIDLNAIGVILMVVGVIGLAFTALIWGPRQRRTYVEDSGAPSRRRVVEEY
jgi:uncharacterized membrane protein